METPYLDEMIDELQNYIKIISEAGIIVPKAKAELAEYLAIKEQLK